MNLTFDTIELAHDEAVSSIVLNRPDRLNAINDQMLEEVLQALEILKDRSETRVVVLKGAGRAFSVGYDLKSDSEEIGKSHERSIIEDWRRLEGNITKMLDLWQFSKPIIAAAHGFCLAGGLQLAMLCDITVVSDDCALGTPSLPIGGGYLSPMLVPLIGPKRAKHLSFESGYRVSGKQSSDWGIVNYSVPEGELFGHVQELAHRIARTPSEVLAVKKYSVNRAADIMGWGTIMPLGAESDAMLHFSESVKKITGNVSEHGFKAATEMFLRGEFV